MSTIRSAALAGAATLALVVPAASAVAGTRSAQPAGDHFTPLVSTLVNAPVPVRAADGRVHLAYEFLLLNPLPATVTVSRLEVLDGGAHVLDDLRAARLEGAFSSFIGGSPTTIEAGHTRRVILDVSVPPGASPRALQHRVTVAEVSLPILANPFLTAPTPVSADRPATVGRPLRGPRWVDLAGCCAAGDHRASLEPINGTIQVGQRFAVDIVRMWPDGRLFHGPADQVTNYAAYGQPVSAAAAGVVVVAQDGRADQIPFQATPPGEPDTIPGNNVIVDLGHGRYAGYAHLKPGSVAVRVGDRVREGDLLGLVGNTGNSDLPHLHFQLMNAPSILASGGLPFVLRSFASAGSIPPGDQIDLEQPIPVLPILSGRFTGVIPMSNQVVDFG